MEVEETITQCTHETYSFAGALFGYPVVINITERKLGVNSIKLQEESSKKTIPVQIFWYSLLNFE